MTIGCSNGLSSNHAPAVLGKMDEKGIKELIKKYNNGTIGEQERLMLDMWYLSRAAESKAELAGEAENELSARLTAALPLKPKRRVVRLWPRIAVAVAIALVIASAGIWFFSSRNHAGYGSRANYAGDARPGRTGGTLTLANGKKIYLTDMKAGQLVQESGVTISKTSDGHIVYKVTDADGAAGKAHILETSNGQQIQVILPDGTTVFLNSASRLGFPSSFAGQARREVTFRGEGFFEVSKDKFHPFVVSSPGQQVEVLGTQFNISSYPEDGAVKTTLIEGSVKVSLATGDTRLLKPGEQSIVSGSGIRLEDAETAYVIAWKNGYFMFDNENLGQIMEKLSRWYDVKIEYLDPGLRSRTFFGSISKFEHISTVLSIMERTGVAHFEIRDNTVFIRKN